MDMNDSDLSRIYEELLEIEGLVLLIKERSEADRRQLLMRLKDKISIVKSHVDGLSATASVIDDTAAQQNAIAETAMMEEAEDADVPDDAEISETFEPQGPKCDKPDNSQQTIQGFGNRCEKSEHADLRKSFTLNDRFRFRRELFGNSDSEMTDTINMVSAMNSYAEAEEYFYEDLGWDSSVEEVKDFMAIVERHFKGRFV